MDKRGVAQDWGCGGAGDRYRPKRWDAPAGSVRIRVVRVGDDLYVRSVNGHSAIWFRGAQDRHEAHIQAGGVEKGVSLVGMSDVNDEVDAAYRAKYRRYAASSVNGVLTSEARCDAQSHPR